MLWKVKKKKKNKSRERDALRCIFHLRFPYDVFFFEIKDFVFYGVQINVCCLLFSSPVGVFRRSSSPILSLSTTGDRAFLASSREYSLLVISVVSADIKPGSGLLQPVCSNWKITAPSQVLLESHFALVLNLPAYVNV